MTHIRNSKERIAMYKKITKKTVTKEYTDNEEDVAEGTDIVLVDVPLMIRLLEYAREEASSDVDLHNLATKLITKSNKWKSWKPLTMADYEALMPAPVTTTTTTPE